MKKKCEDPALVPQCPGCGHRFYKDSPFYVPPNREGLCQYCVAEKNAPKKKAWFCGSCDTQVPGYDLQNGICSGCREESQW